ncbi:uncharacterized protein LOC132624542 [Lycium barbarum]|uniref:uncharacterized protein LOC132624542 n=1 Tax=Lycium barbarum TaxID=112863 RepID=UPI00293E3010|nr:uncharacterized protein LOC132624542 [Lycium barbarum]
MDIENEKTGAIRTVNVQIHYDYLPKYCKECKLQGHDEYDCRIINPERVQYDNEREEMPKENGKTKPHKSSDEVHNSKESNKDLQEDKEIEAKKAKRLQAEEQHNKKQTNDKGKQKQEDGNQQGYEGKKNYGKYNYRGYNNLYNYSARVLAGGRVLGNSGNWNPIKDNRNFNAEKGSANHSNQKETTVTATCNKFNTLVDLEEEQEKQNETQEGSTHSSNPVKETARPWVDAAFGKQTENNKVMKEQGKIDSRQEQDNKKEKGVGDNQSEEIAIQDSERTITDIVENDNKKEDDNKQITEGQDVLQPIEVPDSVNSSSYQQVESARQQVDQMKDLPEEPPDTNNMGEGDTTSSANKEQNNERETQARDQRDQNNKDTAIEMLAISGNHKYQLVAKDNENTTQEEVNQNNIDIGEEETGETISSDLMEGNNKGDISPKHLTKTKKGHKTRDKSVPPKTVREVQTRMACSKGVSQ